MSALRHKRFMAAHHSDEQPNQRRKLDTDGDHDSCAEENKCYKPAASSVVSPVPSSVNKQVRFGNTTVILPHRYEKDRTDAEVLRQYHDDIWYTRDDYKKFWKDRLDTVRVWRSVNGNVDCLDGLYDTRGLEAYRCNAASSELESFRNYHMNLVLREQERQELVASGKNQKVQLDHEKIAQQASVLSDSALERARKMAAQDEASARDNCNDGPGRETSDISYISYNGKDITPPCLPQSPDSVVLDESLLYHQKKRELLHHISGLPDLSPRKKVQPQILPRRDSMALTKGRWHISDKDDEEAIRHEVELMGYQSQSQAPPTTLTPMRRCQVRRSSLLGEEIQRRRSSMAMQNHHIANGVIAQNQPFSASNTPLQQLMQSRRSSFFESSSLNLENEMRNRRQLALSQLQALSPPFLNSSQIQKHGNAMPSPNHHHHQQQHHFLHKAAARRNSISDDYERHVEFCSRLLNGMPLVPSPRRGSLSTQHHVLKDELFRHNGSNNHLLNFHQVNNSDVAQLIFGHHHDSFHRAYHHNSERDYRQRISNLQRQIQNTQQNAQHFEKE